MEINYITKFLGVFELTRNPCRFATNKQDISMFSIRLSGEAEFIYNSEKTKVSAGEVLYLPPNIYYEQQALTDEHLIAVHFRSEHSFDNKIKVFHSDKNIAETLFSDILRCCNEGNMNKCMSLLYDIIHITFESEPQRFERYVPNGFADAVKYLNMHYSKSSTTVSALAKLSGFSETYFRELFKDSFGISPYKYLTKLRMQKAEMLLSGGYYSIKQIAHMCGYDDEKNFSTAFKNYTGQSPSSRLR